MSVTRSPRKRGRHEVELTILSTQFRSVVGLGARTPGSAIAPSVKDREHFDAVLVHTVVNDVGESP
jgi:hypothetical protein